VVIVALVAGLGVAAAAMAGSASWPGEPPVLQIEARYWLVDDLRASALASGSTAGTELDLVRDLGLEEDDQLELRLVWMPGDTHRFRLGWSPLGFDGSHALAGPAMFGDGLYPGGDVVAVDLDQDYYWLNWALRFGGDSFTFGPVLGLHGWTAEVQLEDRTAGGSVRYEKYNNFIPAVGLAFDWTPHRVVTVFFEGSGMSQGSQGWHLDAEAGIKVYPIKNLGIVASYRRLEMKNADEDGSNFADWSVRGAFVGFDVRF